MLEISSMALIISAEEGIPEMYATSSPDLKTKNKTNENGETDGNQNAMNIGIFKVWTFR